MSVTIDDIAKLAGVSPSTVSRAIAGNPRISRETREKVSRIMKEMNYHPNIIARSLANRSTNIIGVIISGSTEKAFQHPFYPEILRGIASIAHKYDYNILISSAADVKEEKHLLDQFVKGRITEGIILMTSRTKDLIAAELAGMDFPFVMVGRPVNDEKVNWVDNDNVTVSYELTRHFIGLGHKKISFIGVTPDYTVTTDRLQGYRKALEESGIPFDEALVVDGQFIDDTGYDMMKTLSERGVKPTGVIACDDLLAFGAVKYLQENGISVPHDVSVAGFNNVPLADFFTPSLTSVEVNPFALGTSALNLLMSNLKSDSKSYNRTIVPARLVVRNSTGRA